VTDWPEVGVDYEGLDGTIRTVVRVSEAGIGWRNKVRYGRCGLPHWSKWVAGRWVPKITASHSGEQRQRGRLVWTCVRDEDGLIYAVAAGLRREHMTVEQWRAWGPVVQRRR
jgi:hypothetical protein